MSISLTAKRRTVWKRIVYNMTIPLARFFPAVHDHCDSAILLLVLRTARHG